MVDTLHTVKHGRYDDSATINRIASNLTNYAEHNGNDWAITGILPGCVGNTKNGLNVTITQNQVRISNGSLCKWWLDNNVQTMSRNDIKLAIEALSDYLGLSMATANVTRLDIAHNLIVEHPAGCYLEHLGELPRHKRMPISNEGVLYKSSRREFVVYDKIKECRHSKQTLPAEFVGKNVLRCELRLKSPVGRDFCIDKVTASMLYNEYFHMQCLQKWAEMYHKINKLNDVIINFEILKTIKALDKFGRICAIEKHGGELEILNNITNAKLAGHLSKDQAYKLRNAVMNTCKNPLYTKPNQYITELDACIADAVKKLI